METTQEILLNSSKNKKEVNENTSLNIALSGNRKLLPEDAISDSLNSYDVYIDERKKSNKFRLVVNINPYCSNVLFNAFTEIVKNEGSSNVICLNYEDDYTEENVIGKDKSFVWNQYEAIRDTQLSNETCGFDYHCGIDIFNNHILRNKTLRAVNFDETNSYLNISKLNQAYGDNFKRVRVNNPAVPHVYIDKDFNTIDDYMRDKSGFIISEHFPKIVLKNYSRYNLETVILPLHLYQNYDIRTFKECINDKLLDDNGWYGFSNPSTLGVTTLKEDSHQSVTTDTTFEIDTTDINCPTESDDVGLVAEKTINKESIDASKIDINKTINNKEYCDYIDMYPGRDLYSFTPKYNTVRKRIEKNWNYCITYPSKSVIMDGEGTNFAKNFPFFEIDQSGNTSLKVYMFDEGTMDDDETALVTIYTVSQHGLTEGDTVNIYKKYTDEVTGELHDDIFYDSAEVVHVIDKYIFQIFKENGNMSDYWVEVTDRELNGMNLANPFKYDENSSPILPQRIISGLLRVGDKYYPICESNRCNVDPHAQNIHIRRVVNGVECKYYVRKFSRLPNFKYKDEEINDFTLYDDNQVKNKKKKRRTNDESLNLIDRFSKPGDPSCEFENHIARLGFANTSYGDDTTEIVFTDDIDTSYLRDNLGRPLSDIFLTIVKNNKGYKEWYGINQSEDFNLRLEIKKDIVEYSHCFGKVNSSFLLSNYFRESYTHAAAMVELYDVRDITANPNERKSLVVETEAVKKDKNFEDEIEFDKDWEYYGDICSYSPIDCDEQIIQTAMHRFNTAQRELSVLNAPAACKRFKCPNCDAGTICYDEIYDVENTLIFDKSNDGDPYMKFKNGSANPKAREEITANEENLYHTTREKLHDMLNFKEGYYYQPHYRINVKTVSRELSTDKAIEYEIVEIKNPNAKSDVGRTLFEIKTATGNYFCENEKVVLYKRSTNEYYFVTVYGIVDFNRFTCVIADEQGEHVTSIEGFLDIENINDYVLVKKHEDTPAYARLIRDGSCRYCWREVISNGIESNERVYPFTNDAFYINRQINFFLRRQDPKKEYLGFKTGTGEGELDFVPDGEDIRDYPNFDPVNETNYEANEIKEC